MKALVSGILNYPLVLAALFLFCAGAIRKKLAFDHVALGAVIFSFVSVFAFFTAYGSYFAMLLPLLLLLMAKLAIARSSIGAGRPATIPESRGSRPRSRSI
jgi:hypothetical protein